MKLKPFKKTSRKQNSKNILIISSFLVIISLIIVVFSYSLYEQEDEALMISGQVGTFCEVGQTWTFSYVEDDSGNGYEQTFNVPCDGNYRVELWGAQGATGGSRISPGNGGYTSGNIELDKNLNLYVYVGSAGNATSFGFNGGAPGEAAGGGATDIRLDNGA